jgi:hypothetical protein
LWEHATFRKNRDEGGDIACSSAFTDTEGADKRVRQLVPSRPGEKERQNAAPVLLTAKYSERGVSSTTTSSSIAPPTASVTDQLDDLVPGLEPAPTRFAVRRVDHFGFLPGRSFVVPRRATRQS